VSSRPDTADRSTVLAHYTAGIEQKRLDAGPGQLERARSREILARYLPEPPAWIADVGGGPGAYAAWLARLGHQVDLLDLVPLHVQQANDLFRREGLTGARAEQGDARELPYADRSRDAVLLMGPLYHLPEREDRMRALREAFRVLRPGGTLVAAFISRFASLMDGYFGGLIADPLFLPIVEEDLASGRHENPTDNPFYFTSAYLHHPDEILPELAEAGFVGDGSGEAGSAGAELFAVEGPFWCLADFDEHWANGERRERLLGYLRRLERDRSLVGMSAHLLAVARRE
jgi:SAM-dependent methyltransferase